jgi:hypothetical protein
MSKYYDLNKKLILEIKFPEEKFKPIMNFFEIKNLKETKNKPFNTKKLIFLITFREFLKGNFMLEEFSEVANLIKQIANKNSSEEEKDFEEIIYEAADLPLHLRLKPENRVDNINIFLKSMWKYFNKNIHLINDAEEFSKPTRFEE